MPAVHSCNPQAAHLIPPEMSSLPPPPPLPAPGPHQPVLQQEVLELLAPRPGGSYCDGTVGYGGHAAALLAAVPDARLWAGDRDQDALDAARTALASFSERVSFIHTPLSQLRDRLEAAGAPLLDGVLLDLGVSSPQLDRAERGFSFRRPGPLDMRMDRSAGRTAADYLREVREEDLAAVLRDLGEERYARRIARDIVAARRDEPITTTDALAALVARAIPRREHHKDPATRTFQALRIVVNDELGELEQALADLPGLLAPGGRLLVISFHSLEDRMVKRRFRALAEAAAAGGPDFRVLTKKPVTAADAELAGNPRARSAKLRALERGDGRGDESGGDGAGRRGGRKPWAR
jgi:16S rRNA (cytosine1402-N4)-methyltransferase